LLKHGSACGIVLHQCERAGALDSNIRNAVNNDFRKVTRVARGLKRVCFNGKTAGRFAPVFAEGGYETLVLPSSSPAYTLALDAKLKAWRGVLMEPPHPKARRDDAERALRIAVLMPLQMLTTSRCGQLAPVTAIAVIATIRRTVDDTRRIVCGPIVHGAL
jgi:hypothetical protein